MSRFSPEAPSGDEITTPWWEATRDHRLVIQRCVDCAAFQHPPRAICIACGHLDSLTFEEVAGYGVVDSWTAVYRSPVPDVPIPYVIARVKLMEGPVLLTQLLGRTTWKIGVPVVLDWMPMEDGRALPVFRQDEL